MSDISSQFPTVQLITAYEPCVLNMSSMSKWDVMTDDEFSLLSQC